mgnify:FL=1
MIPQSYGCVYSFGSVQDSQEFEETEKILKHRFWTEIYEGAKMFYFSGVVNGKYLKNEVNQLTLYIGRAKVSFFVSFQVARIYQVSIMTKQILLVTSSE